MERDSQQRAHVGKIWYHDRQDKPHVPAGSGAIWMKKKDDGTDEAVFVVADKNGKLWKLTMQPHED